MKASGRTSVVPAFAVPVPAQPADLDPVAHVPKQSVPFQPQDAAVPDAASPDYYKMNDNYCNRADFLNLLFYQVTMEPPGSLGISNTGDSQ